MWKVTVFVGFVALALLRKIMRYRRQCPSSQMMNDKTVIITGANSGIGEATAYELARRKARVILACRDMTLAQQTVLKIQRSTGNKSIFAKELNLASLKSIQAFCKRIMIEETEINVLINNAGVFQCPYGVTEDGFENQMGINHFGHFLLTNLLLPHLLKSSPSRVVIVSSSLHKKGSINFDDINSRKHYRKSKAYSDSKLANLLFARQLAAKVQEHGVDVLSLHPGMVATNLGRHVVTPWKAKILFPIAVMLGLRDAQEGCQPVVYCAVAREFEGRSGVYVDKNCAVCPWTPAASDDHAAKKLWKVSERMTFVGHRLSE